MLSMERQRFKAQPLTRSCLPYEAPHHLPPPPRMRPLGKREGEFHTRRINQTKTISMAPRKLIARTRASEELTHHTHKRTHTQEVTELYTSAIPAIPHQLQFTKGDSGFGPDQSSTPTNEVGIHDYRGEGWESKSIVKYPELPIPHKISPLERA